jgi:hypothetical protein
VLFGAKDEARTRDPDLGKVVLYQLSYFRIGMAKLTEIRFVQTENLNFYGKKIKTSDCFKSNNDQYSGEAPSK